MVNCSKKLVNVKLELKTLMKKIIKYRVKIMNCETKWVKYWPKDLSITQAVLDLIMAL